MTLARRALVPCLVLLGYALAFVQRPGKAIYDSRIEVSVDPALFLHRVASVWSPTVDLGHVQSGQFVGYLFPMAPWFAATDAAGVPMWIAQRLWIGTILAVSAYGVVRLLDTLYHRERGIAHFAAGVLYIANPFIVVYATRGTITLLAYAALPWLLLAAHKGMGEPRRWRWPAAMGLVVAAAGGGVNFAVLFWVALAPLGLVAYEVFVQGKAGRAAWQFLVRAAVCVAGASLWWVVPVVLSSSGGNDFLSFTEQPDSILLTPSMSESLRLMGYWVTYLGVGIGGSEPLVPSVSSYLFSLPVIAGSFMVPLLALGGARYLRRWTYAPFLGLLAVVGLLVMSLGFPPGTPMNKLFEWAYYHLSFLQPLRTTYKAAPLVALPLACLGGAALAALVARARAGGLSVLRTRVPAWGLAIVFLFVAVMFARPLVSGTAIDAQQAYGKIPKTWTAAITAADRSAPRDHRLMMLPGELFGYYRWGGTYTSIAPALTRREVLIREIERHADPLAAQLQISTDELITQGRLVPNQLDPLLQLMGVGQVLVAADGKRLRSASIDQVALRQSLRYQRGFRVPLGSYGPDRPAGPSTGHAGTPELVPDLRRYGAPGPGPGIVRIHPVRRPTVVEGDADGVADLAAVGSLGVDRALFYEANLSGSSLQRRIADGAELSFTDSNRRRQVISSRLTQDTGPTLTANEPFGLVWPSYDPFPKWGPAGRTVAVYSGLRYLYTPRTPGFTLFPQYRPYAALDGRLDTTWVADTQKKADRYIALALTHPRKVDHIDLFPHADGLGRTRNVAISVNGGPELPFRLTAGWNRLPIRATLRSLRVRVTKVVGFGFIGGQGGIDELRIPGLKAREALRLPTALATRTRKLDLRGNPVSVVLQRTLGDFPYRSGREVVNAQAQDELDMVDAENGMNRIVTLPQPRAFSGDGWASVSPAAHDDDIDRLAGGLPPGWRFTSSARFEGVPVNRASSAFDGDPRTAWIGDLTLSPTPFIAVSAPHPITIRRFQLVPPSREYRFPSRVRVSSPAGPITVRVGPGGWVALPAPQRVSGLRLDLIGIRAPTAFQRQRKLRAVGIAEIRVPGLNPPRPNRTGAFASRCGELNVRAGASAIPLQVRGTVPALDQGSALPLRPCGPRTHLLALPRGPSRVQTPPGPVMRTDYLRLRSPAPDLSPPGAPSPGTLVSPGRATDDSRRDGVKLDLQAPAWVVLGQSWSSDWRAWCRQRDGRDLALGTPEMIDGYANGWLVGRDCREVRMFFTPQRAATTSYIVSGLIAAALLAVVLLGFVRLRRRSRPPPPVPPRTAAGTPPVPLRDDERVPAAIAGGAPQAGEAAALGPPLPDPVLRLAWPATIGLAVAAAAFGIGLFGLKGGAILAVLALVFAREGASSGRLLAVAALGLVALPIVYLATPVADEGGFDFAYSMDHLPAHYVAVGAVACVAAAFALDAVRVRRRTAARSASPTSATDASTTNENSAP